MQYLLQVAVNKTSLLALALSVCCLLCQAAAERPDHFSQRQAQTEVFEALRDAALLHLPMPAAVWPAHAQIPALAQIPGAAQLQAVMAMGWLQPASAVAVHLVTGPLCS